MPATSFFMNYDSNLTHFLYIRAPPLFRKLAHQNYLFMPLNTADAERKRRIGRVIDYILAHPTQDTSLETLAGVANYSAFHPPPKNRS